MRLVDETQIMSLEELISQKAAFDKYKTTATIKEGAEELTYYRMAVPQAPQVGKVCTYYYLKTKKI